MKSQPKHNSPEHDLVMTPPEAARDIVRHFHLFGKVLDPCRGEGAFYNAFENCERLWCEISEGKPFANFHEHVDWIVTNPPWSKFRVFLHHSMEISDHVVFLVTINHLWTKARVRDIETSGFGIVEILCISDLKGFPPMGFQLGVVHLARGYRGMTRISFEKDWRD